MDRRSLCLFGKEVVFFARVQALILAVGSRPMVFARSGPPARVPGVTLDERLSTFLGRGPRIDPTAFVATGAVVVGDVRLGPHVSIWHCAVLRGDINFIEIGEGTNIQDGAVVHLADEFPARIGRRVTVGHGAIVHACTIGDGCLIGMRATIMDGAVIGAHSIVGAGALVTAGTMIPEGSMVLGAPAKVVRMLTAEERAGLEKWAQKYVRIAQAHKSRLG